MRLNKPHGDPHSAPNTLHRTFNQGLHAQLTCNLIGALVGAPVSHDRSTGNHAQRLYFCKVGDELFGHAVGKEFFRPGGEVRKRQHGYRGDLRLGSDATPRKREDQADGDGGHENRDYEHLRMLRPDARPK